MTKTILSLFDYSGNWSYPYFVTGYNVVQVDIKHGHDILAIDADWLDAIGPVHGILAAPPCTDFSGSGAQYWPAKDADGRTAASVDLVRKTLEIVEHYRVKGSLAWWALENPVGRLNRCVPELAPHGPWYFQPYDYGNPYTKKTGLWGEFNRDLPQSPVVPEKVCSQGSWLMKLGGKSEKTKELRSMTPMGFAVAFYHANP